MQEAHSRNIGRGVGWMLLFKLLERSLGIVSTLVLVRLLVPADFGVVAMAQSFIVMVQLLGALGFDVALIHDQSASSDHYNTAWTLNAALGLLITLIMVGLSHPIASFYGKPELVGVVCALSLVSLVSGLENIGVVAFRKELRFRSEFAFQLSRKLAGIAVTIPLALALRSYWALVIGTLSSCLVGTLISYLAHPFRPRLSLAKASELLDFSRWLLLGNVIGFVRERSSDFFIGRLAGPAALGVYSVSYEISNLPTTELSAPINRALMPGFSKIANDPAALQQTYLQAFSLLVLLTVPAAVGILVLADFLVPVLLGPKWLEAVPLIQLLAITGVFQALQSSSATALIATGHPKSVFMTNALYAIVLLVFLGLLVPSRGATGAALATGAAVLTATPVFLLFLRRHVGIPFTQIGRHMWRPTCSAIAMLGALLWFLPAYARDIGHLAAAGYLAAGTLVGAVVYASVVWILWLLADKPGGGEQILLAQLRAAIVRLSSQTRQAH
jgi:lipopolysaccharide exporter